MALRIAYQNLTLLELAKRIADYGDPDALYEAHTRQLSLESGCLVDYIEALCEHHLRSAWGRQMGTSVVEHARDILLERFARLPRKAPAENSSGD